MPPMAGPTWLLVLKITGVVVSIASLLLIYLPDLPMAGRWFYPLYYEQLIAREANAQGLDPFFVAAVIRQESGFRPRIRSAVGAVGLMQVMPTTARWIASRLHMSGYKDAQLDDPEINVRIGCWYLAYLFNRFKTVDKVLAAYNGGEGNLDYWGTLQGEQLAYAYPETQSYVAQCLRAYGRYRDLYSGDPAWADRVGIWSAIQIGPYAGLSYGPPTPMAEGSPAARPASPPPGGMPGSPRPSRAP